MDLVPHWGSFEPSCTRSQKMIHVMATPPTGQNTIMRCTRQINPDSNAQGDPGTC